MRIYAFSRRRTDPPPSFQAVEDDDIVLLRFTPTAGNRFSRAAPQSTVTSAWLRFRALAGRADGSFRFASWNDLFLEHAGHGLFFLELPAIAASARPSPLAR